MALLKGVESRLYPVGRLDFNSEGLLLMTNDGALAQVLMGPEHEIPKVYLVKVHRNPSPALLKEFQEGFLLSGRRLKPCHIEIAEKGDNPWLKVTLTEGKNQQIRRMFAAVGHPVSKLRRVQFGPLADPLLKPGAWRFLSPQEIAAIKSQSGEDEAPHRKQHFPQEAHQGGDEGGHGENEQGSHNHGHVGLHHCAQEHCGNADADQQRRAGAEGDAQVHQMPPPGQGSHLHMDGRRPVFRSRFKPLIQDPGPVHDARQPVGHHPQDGPDGREQEHRRHRQLDDMGNVVDGLVRNGRKHHL